MVDMNKKSHSLLLMLLVSGRCIFNVQPVHCDPHPTLKILPASPVKFKSSTLEGQVDESIQHSKQGVLGYIIQLMKSHHRSPDIVLSYFEKYKNNSNEDVKFSVIVAASNAHTRKAMDILTTMSTDHDVSNDAIAAIYNGYTQQQISGIGGIKLKTALVRAFIFDRSSTYSPLLLSLFGRKKTTIALLKRRLISYDSSNYAPQIVCINLALANLGDTSAKSKIVDDFSRNHTQNLLSIMSHLKFVQDRTVLSHVVSLLNNKNNANEVGFPEGPPEYTRLCDEAMVALQVKFDPSQPRSYGPPRRFTDAELLAAYKKYSALLAARDRRGNR